MLVSINCSEASSSKTCKPNSKRNPHGMSGHRQCKSAITKGNSKQTMAVSFKIKD